LWEKIIIFKIHHHSNKAYTQGKKTQQQIHVKLVNMKYITFIMRAVRIRELALAILFSICPLSIINGSISKPENM